MVVETAVHGFFETYSSVSCIQPMFHLAEAEPAEIRWPRDTGPGGRFLRDRHHTGLAAVDDLVQLAQEGDGSEVLPAAMDIRHHSPCSRE